MLSHLNTRGSETTNVNAEAKRTIGCCARVFGDAPLRQVAQLVTEAGLEAIELRGDPGTNPKDAAKIFSDHGLGVCSITPGDADISHPDAKIRMRACGHYEWLCDFAATIGQPVVVVRGLAGKVRAIIDHQRENEILIDSVKTICVLAEQRGLVLAFAVLNHYESYQINNIQQGLQLIKRVGADNLGLLANAYHMNIEEVNPAKSLIAAGEHITLYHAVDSHGGTVGTGHTDFAAQAKALDKAGYVDSVVLAINSPQADSFAQANHVDSQREICAMLQSSAGVLAKAGF